MQDATENCHNPKLVEEAVRLELNFPFPLEHVTEIIVLGERLSSVAVGKFGANREKYLKWIMFLCSKNSTVAHYSSIGTVVLFPLTMFQPLAMRLLTL